MFVRQVSDGSVFLKVNQGDAILFVLAVSLAVFVMGAVVGLFFGSNGGKHVSATPQKYLRPRAR